MTFAWRHKRMWNKSIANAQELTTDLVYRDYDTISLVPAVSGRACLMTSSPELMHQIVDTRDGSWEKEQNLPQMTAFRYVLFTVSFNVQSR